MQMLRDGIVQTVPTSGYLLNGMSRSNYDKMSLDELYAEGWSDLPIVEEIPIEEIEPIVEIPIEPVEPIPLTEEQLQELYDFNVANLIRQRYSLDDELAIQRQKDVKADEFNTYYAYCEECKMQAKNTL